MYNKQAKTSPSAIQPVPECYKTQKMCVKAVNTCPFESHTVSDRYEMQEICDKASSNNSFMLEYFHN